MRKLAMGISVMAAIDAGFAAFYAVSGRWLFALLWLALTGLWLVFWVVVNYIEIVRRPVVVVEIVMSLRPDTTEKETEDEQGN